MTAFGRGRQGATQNVRNVQRATCSLGGGAKGESAFACLELWLLCVCNAARQPSKKGDRSDFAVYCVVEERFRWVQRAKREGKASVARERREPVGQENRVVDTRFGRRSRWRRRRIGLSGRRWRRYGSVRRGKRRMTHENSASEQERRSRHTRYEYKPARRLCSQQPTSREKERERVSASVCVCVFVVCMCVCVCV